MASKRITEALYQVAKVFIARDKPDPFKRGEKLDFELDLQLKVYMVDYPPGKHERTITPRFLRHCYNKSSTPKENHMSVLLILALFFALRSYEHLLVAGTRKTKISCVKHVVFVNPQG